MAMNNDSTSPMPFDALLTELRPRLHRYCARMTGSVIDGEDVVQDALLKAFEAHGQAVVVDNPVSWLFRIAHNTAIDFLRRRKREIVIHTDEDLDMIGDTVASAERRVAVSASLATFMGLPVQQRSTVILMDVLGCSLEEIADSTGSSIPAIKAALHRGRSRLQALSQSPEPASPPVLIGPDRDLLVAYVERFNAHDFGALQSMLANDVRLDIVSRTEIRGRQQVVDRYFHNYSRATGWRATVGFVDGQPAILMNTSGAAGRFDSFIVLNWKNAEVVHIRDFTHARYVMESATVIPFAN